MSYEPLSETIEQRIEDACKRFRELWQQWEDNGRQQGNEPRIASLMNELQDNSVQSAFVVEHFDRILERLLHVEVYERNKLLRPAPDLGILQREFPQHAQLIENVLVAPTNSDRSSADQRNIPDIKSFIPPEVVTGTKQEYERIERIAWGGMGTVWKYIGRSAPVTVAIKFALRARLTRAKKTAAAWREANVLLDHYHSNLLKVIDARVDVSPPFIVMEYVRGTLAQRISNGPLSPLDAANIMAQVADAVAYLHNQTPEIYHRDLKPANILMDREKPLVADLGLFVDEDEQLHLLGDGTPLYMSPEQIRCETDIYKAADIWALGVILYETLTGKRPFRAIDEITTLTHSHQNARAVRDIIPDALAELCNRCLNKDKNARLRTVGEFKKTLLDWIASQPENQHPNSAAPQPIQSNVRDRLISFIGRIRELKEIAQLLANHPSVGLHSRQGGVGKTELAIAYGNEARQRGDYPGGVFIIRGDGDWHAELASLAELLGLPILDGETVEQTAARVRRRLQHDRPKSLLIIDNVVDALKWREVVSKNWLPGGACQWLITTRCDALRTVKMMRVGGLEIQDGVNLLARFRDDAALDENAPVVERVVAMFGPLTVGLTITGVFMRDVGTSVSWSDCEAKLTAAGLTTVTAMEEGARDARPDRYELLVNEIFNDLLDRLDPPTRRALDYAALLPAGQFPRHWLAEYLIDDPEITFNENLPGGERIPAAERVVEALEDRLELLRPDVAEQTTAARSTRESAGLAETVSLANDSTDQNRLVDSLDRPSQTPVRDRGALVSLHNFLRDHLRRGLMTLDQQTYVDALRNQIATLFQHHVSELNKHQPTYKPFIHELGPLTRLAGELPDDPNLADAYTILGLALNRTNRLADAEPLMRRALDICVQSLGEGHPNVATCLNNLAQLLQDTNRLAEAEPLMHRALAIDEKSYGAEHPNVAIRLNNLAVLLHATNRLAEAEPLMRRVVDVFEKSLGADHPTVAMALNNLAQWLYATNRLADAEPMMRRVLTMFEKSLGEDHPNVAMALNGLALLLQDTNRLAEAEPMMRRALAIDEQSYGAEHPKVAIRLNNLAGLLWKTNRLAEAKSLMRRALAIVEQSYGAEHPNVATDLNNLAQLLLATNRLSEAERLMRRALAIDEQSFGPEHPNVARDLNNLARLLQDTNRLAGAEPLMRRALAMDEQSFGPEHPRVARCLHNLALLLQATNRLAEAELLMRRTEGILIRFQEVNGHRHPELDRVLDNIRSMSPTWKLSKEGVREWEELSWDLPASFGSFMSGDAPGKGSRNDSVSDSNPRRGMTIRSSSQKTGRNDPCRCGSGKKFKKCCGRPAQD